MTEYFLHASALEQIILMVIVLAGYIAVLIFEEKWCDK